MEKKFTIPSLHERRDRLSNLMQNEADKYKGPEKTKNYGDMLNQWDTTCDLQVVVDHQTIDSKDYDNVWCQSDDTIYIQGIFEERAAPHPCTLPKRPKTHPSEYMSAYQREVVFYFPRYDFSIYTEPSDADLVTKRMRRNNKISKAENNRMINLLRDSRAFKGSPLLSSLAKLKYAGALFTIFHNVYLDYKKKKNEEEKLKLEKAALELESDCD